MSRNHQRHCSPRLACLVLVVLCLSAAACSQSGDTNLQRELAAARATPSTAVAPPATFSGSSPARPSPTLSPPPTRQVPTPVATPSLVQWQQISPGGVSTDFDHPAQNYGFQAIAVDANDSGSVYVGTCYQGLWKSLDAGQSWFRVDRPGVNGVTLNGRLWSIAIDHFHPQTMYVANGYGTGQGVFKSTDGGATFQQMLPQAITQVTSEDVSHIETDPYQPDHLLVSWHGQWKAPRDTGIAESTDGGTTWVLHDPPRSWGSEIAGVYFLANSHTWLVATSAAGMWKTSDSGTTWRQVTTENASGSGDMLYHASNDAWYIGATDGILRSTDTGDTWKRVVESGLYMAIIGDGVNLYAQIAATGSNQMPAGFITSPERDGTRWSSMSTQTFTDGPISMAYDRVRHIVYASNWTAGVWKLEGGRPLADSQP